MFSMICKSDRKAGTMGCCKVQRGWRLQLGWWQGTSSCVGSGALLVLLPKCPMCIAAYLTLWTGAGVAMPIAMHLRPMMAILFLASLFLLGFRWAVRMRSQNEVGNKQSS
jgi:hypothetical protein